MLGGFGTGQPLVLELHCREERLLLMQSRARRARRKATASVGGIRQGTSRDPWWSGGTHGGGSRHGVWESGQGSGRHCLLLSACASSTASMLYFSHALIFPQESHLFQGPPAHPSIYLTAQCKARGPCWSHPCPPRLSGRAGQAVRFSPREGLEHSLSPPTLGTCPYDEQGACCSPAPRGETRDCPGSWPLTPSLSREAQGL